MVDTLPHVVRVRGSIIRSDLASTPTPTVREVLGRPATSLASVLADHRAAFT